LRKKKESVAQFKNAQVKASFGGLTELPKSPVTFLSKA